MKKQVIIVGAGASGVGMGVVLQKMGVDFVILERHEIGHSFRSWPKEMHWISPSFTGNNFGAVDLNAVSPDSSPAFAIGSEHPSGREYAEYLEMVAGYYKLPTENGCEVASVVKEDDEFILETNKGTYQAQFVIWAGGEYQFPNDKPFDGFEHCIHNSTIDSWADLGGEEFVVIGGYESGIDSAYHLARNGKTVTVIDSGNQLVSTESDSSCSVSPYTKDRYNQEREHIEIVTNTRVERVEKTDDGYDVHTSDVEVITSLTRPILATGFRGGLGLVESLFEYDDDAPILTEHDESTKTPGLFLAGPQVQHGAIIFCFVYKYRQRWPVVGEQIAERLGVDSSEMVSEYRRMNMYLADLSCCGDECAC